MGRLGNNAPQTPNTSQVKTLTVSHGIAHPSLASWQVLRQQEANFLHNARGEYITDLKLDWKIGSCHNQ
jgi:hypothetical protein